LILNILITTLLVLLIIGAAGVIIFDDGDSGRKLSWLLIIAIFPVVGILLYLMFGINYRHHWFFNRRHLKYLETFRTEADERLRKLLKGDAYLEQVRPDWRPLVKLLSTDNSNMVTGGNSVEIITNGKRKFDLLEADLLSAKDYIHVEYFLFGDDTGSRRIKEILMLKAREGVKVRFIQENIANLTIRDSYYNEMRKAGVEVVKFTNPRKHLLNFVTVLNYRDHRKIVVIDGRIGFTGGMNIKDRYFLEWRDTHMRITGNAVASLQNSFLNSWLTAGGSLDHPYMYYFPPASPAPSPLPEPEPDSAPLLDLSAPLPVLQNVLVQVVPDEPDSRWPLTQMGYMWTAANAKRYLYLQTPYFVPPEPVLDALKAAALSGVDVRLMLPKKADSPYMDPANKSFFSECLSAGIRIYERGDNFMHSKTFVCDDYLSQIGTSNIDYRSFSINYEVNTFLFDEATARMNKAIFLKDLEYSTEISRPEWNHRPWYKKLVERIVRLFAPLL
jgi:cardiolipin synthase